MNRTNSSPRSEAGSSPRSVAACLVLALALVTAGCQQARSGPEAGEYPSQIDELAVHRERPDPLVQAQVRGREVYLHYCQICHGSEGQGDGFNSGNLAVSPRDFSDEQFWKTSTEEQLTTAISTGGASVGKSVLMPAWGKTLGKARIHDVVVFLRTIPAAVRQAEEAAEKDGTE